MSTRKLILLALACGLAILVAGSIQLLRIKDNQVSTLAVGDSTELATVTAALLDSTADASGVTVLVRLGLQADAQQAVSDASVGWRLLVSGESSFAEPQVADGGSQPTCVGLAVAPGATVECTMRFGRAPTAASVLYFAFGGADATWAL